MYRHKKKLNQLAKIKWDKILEEKKHDKIKERKLINYNYNLIWRISFYPAKINIFVRIHPQNTCYKRNVCFNLRNTITFFHYTTVRATSNRAHELFLLSSFSPTVV